MQNTQIWKSIEALCDEAEAVIKKPTLPTLEHQETSGPTEITLLSSKPAPPLAKVIAKSLTHTDAEFAILSSKPAPPLAKVIVKSVTHSEQKTKPLSTATMAEIAAAIDRAANAAHKPQIMHDTSTEISDAFRKSLINEVGQTVHTALANELPQIVRRAVSESFHELMSKSAKSTPIGLKLDGLAEIAKKQTPKVTKKATKKKTGSKKKVAAKKVDETT